MGVRVFQGIFFVLWLLFVPVMCVDIFAVFLKVPCDLYDTFADYFLKDSADPVLMFFGLLLLLLALVLSVWHLLHHNRDAFRFHLVAVFILLLALYLDFHFVFLHCFAMPWF